LIILLSIPGKEKLKPQIVPQDLDFWRGKYIMIEEGFAPTWGIFDRGGRA
jgi:hypothetical protein